MKRQGLLIGNRCRGVWLCRYVIIDDQLSKTEGHALMSHQTGAIFSTLLDHNIEFIAEVKLSMTVQMAKEQAPIFHD